MEHFPPRVLVLEDDEQVRDIVTEMLSEAGIQVDAAADGLTALEKIDRTEFDLIIADIQLPGEVDGLETIRCARARYPFLRSLFISGKGRSALEDPEADDFIKKPFSSRELLGCVWEVLLRDPPRRPAGHTKRCADRWVAAAKVDCLRRQRRSDRFTVHNAGISIDAAS
jgi:two-component system OmpR family response regulator